MAGAFWLVGLILVTFCGWACASYATNFIYRLPRGEYPFGRKPYCGECNTLLQPKDLFPIFSWLLTGGKCRYCGAGVPASYFWIEVIGTALFPFIYVQYGFGDIFLLLALASLSLLSLAMMAYDDDYFSPNTAGLVALCGVLTGTLRQGSFTDSLLGMFLAFMLALGVYAWRIGKQKPEWDLRGIPAYIWLAAIAGAWLPLPIWAGCMAAWAALFWLLRWIWKRKAAQSLLIISYAPLLLVGIFWVV